MTMIFQKKRQRSAIDKAAVSSKWQITKVLMIFVVPFLLLLICYNIYAVYTFDRSLTEAGEDFVDIYLEPIEEGTSAMQTSVVDIISNDSDFQQLVVANGTREKFTYIQKVADRFQRILGITSAAAGYIIFD